MSGSAHEHAACPQVLSAFVITLLAGALQQPSHAQSPLTIEQLIVDPARLQLTGTFSHRAASQGPWVAAEDTLWKLGIRYGLSRNLEVNAALQQSTLEQHAGAESKNRRDHAVDAGLNWRIKGETRSPALLAEIRGTLRDWSSIGAYSFPRVELLLTGYKSLDPVVLSLTLALEKSRYRSDGRNGEDRDIPASGWRIEPMINFAVNPTVTLLGGFYHLRYAAPKRGGVPSALPLVRTALRVGAGYAASEHSTFFMTGDLASDSAGTALGLQWLYQF